MGNLMVKCLRLKSLNPLKNSDPPKPGKSKKIIKSVSTYVFTVFLKMHI